MGQEEAPQSRQTEPERSLDAQNPACPRVGVFGEDAQAGLLLRSFDGPVVSSGHSHPLAFAPALMGSPKITRRAHHMFSQMGRRAASARMQLTKAVT